ncbi:MAG TPA: site-specific integrase [Thermomicrobiales bacterium]|nr:site-specific integrase [Thermomicrobiales bacterium]
MTDGKKSRRGHNKGGKYKGDRYYIEALSLGYTTNRQGKRVRARKYFYGKTRREAEEKKNRWLTEREREERLRAKGIDVDHHRMPFAEFVEEWFSTSVTGKVKPSTESNYRNAVKSHLLPAFGDTPLNEIRPQAGERMLRQKEGQLKPSTLKALLTVLRTILNTAVRWRYIERNPASDVRHDFGDIRGNRRYLSHEQEAALFAQDMAPWERSLYRLAIDTGLRQGELLALQWSDINTRAGHPDGDPQPHPRQSGV